MLAMRFPINSFPFHRDVFSEPPPPHNPYYEFPYCGYYQSPESRYYVSLPEIKSRQIQSSQTEMNGPADLLALFSFPPNAPLQVPDHSLLDKTTDKVRPDINIREYF